MSASDPLIPIPPQRQSAVPDSALENTEAPSFETHLENYQFREKEAAIRKKEHALEVERVMLTQRQQYAARLFRLSIGWLVFIGLYLTLAGFGILKVADPVLIALISTTTINVLGLFYIVARWMFPNNLVSEQPFPDKQ